MGISKMEELPFERKCQIQRERKNTVPLIDLVQYGPSEIYCCRHVDFFAFILVTSVILYSKF